MTELQLKELLKKYGLKETTFTKKEIETAGSDIKDICVHAFEKLVHFRALIDTPVHFVFNGITTGNHKSSGHPEGKAFDIRVSRATSYDVFKNAINAGLKKIGIYWNGKTYSYHLEDAPAAFWQGKKTKPGKGSWKFSPLIKNPAH